MFTSLQTQLKRASRLLPVALLSSFAAQAQLGYSPTTAVNAAGTYTDLAATGTAISTANNYDDANSAAQGIGFTFTFNGTAFTQFVLNTNGFIKLGATAPSAAALFLPESLTATQIDPFESTNAADVNILAPFNFDLMAGTAAGGTEYRVATTGNSPNRVCTIQWKNVADKTLEYDQQYGSMNFQVKLYETTNNIEFVYGTTVQGTLPDDYRFAVVGIKGSSITNNQSIVVNKPGTGATAWSATTFSTGFYTTDAFNYSGNVRPDVGRTYRFAPGTVPTAVNDDPTTAITLTLGATCTPTNGTNVNATTTTVNGYTNGTNPNAACGIAVNPKDVWYKFTTAASGAGSTSATIQVTGNAAGYLRAFSTTGGAAGPFTEIGCASGGTNNTVSAPLSLTALTPSTTYYIFVSGFGSGDTQGAFTICATATSVTPPTGLANDNCATATVLTPGTTCTGTAGTVTGATQSRAPILCAGYTAATAQDVWYSFVATGATHTIAVTGTFDGVMEVLSGTCAAPVNIGCSDASTANNETLTLTTLTPGSTYLVRYYPYFANPASGTFSICVTSPASNDAAVSAVYTLGQLSPYASPHTVRAVVRNAGTTAQTNLAVTLNVTGANTFTNTQTVATLAPGASATVTFAPYPSGATGTNTVTVSVPADAVTANNSVAETQTVSTSNLGYVASGTTTFAGGFGSNSTTVTTATFYSKYTAPATSTAVSAVTPTFVGTTTASNNYQVLVLAASSTGTPGTVLYTSPVRVRPLAGGPDVVTIPAVPVSGAFFVAVRQLSTTNFGLAYQDESPLRAATFYASNDGVTFTDLSVAGTTFRPALAVTLATVTATRNEALAATVGLAPNPAHGSFQLLVPAGNLHAATATLSNALGQTVLVRQLNLPAAGGTADFDVSRLANGVYSLTLKSGNDVVVKRVVVE